MAKRVAAVLAMVGVLFAALITTGQAAFAGTGYPAPPVSSSAYPAPAVTSSQVLVTDPASSSVSAVLASADPSAPADPGSLAYTGVPFNVTWLVLIGALIIIGGFALVVLGGRRAWIYRPRHGRR
jgi:LPXTG-motif cell wall-anchored protein